MPTINSSQQSSQKQSSTQPTSQRQSSSSPLRLPDTPSQYSRDELNLLNMPHLSPSMLANAQTPDATLHSDPSASVDLSPLMLAAAASQYSRDELNLLNMPHLSPSMLANAQTPDATLHSNPSASLDLSPLMLAAAATTHNTHSSNSSTTHDLSAIISSYPSIKRDEIAHGQKITKILMEVADALISQEKPITKKRKTN